MEAEVVMIPTTSHRMMRATETRRGKKESSSRTFEENILQLPPWSPVSTLQNFKATHLFCLSYQVGDVLLHQSRTTMKAWTYDFSQKDEDKLCSCLGFEWAAGVKQSFCSCPIKFCPNRANSQKIQCLTGAQYTPAKWMASWRCWNVPFLDFFLIRFFKRAYLRNFSFYKADVTSVIWSVQGKCLMSAGLRVAYRNVWFPVLAFALHAYHRSPQHIG